MVKARETDRIKVELSDEARRAYIYAIGEALLVISNPETYTKLYNLKEELKQAKPMWEF